MSSARGDLWFGKRSHMMGKLSYFSLLLMILLYEKVYRNGKLRSTCFLCVLIGLVDKWYLYLYNIFNKSSSSCFFFR